MACFRASAWQPNPGQNWPIRVRANSGRDPFAQIRDRFEQGRRRLDQTPTRFDQTRARLDRYALNPRAATFRPSSTTPELASPKVRVVSSTTLRPKSASFQPCSERVWSKLRLASTKGSASHQRIGLASAKLGMRFRQDRALFDQKRAPSNTSLPCLWRAHACRPACDWAIIISARLTPIATSRRYVG